MKKRNGTYKSITKSSGANKISSSVKINPSGEASDMNVWDTSLINYISIVMIAQTEAQPIEQMTSIVKIFINWYKNIIGYCV